MLSALMEPEVTSEVTINFPKKKQYIAQPLAPPLPSKKPPPVAEAGTLLPPEDPQEVKADTQKEVVEKVSKDKGIGSWLLWIGAALLFPLVFGSNSPARPNIYRPTNNRWTL